MKKILNFIIVTIGFILKIIFYTIAYPIAIILGIILGIIEVIKDSNKQKQQKKLLEKENQERQRVLREQEQERRTKIMNMVDDIQTWISTDFVNELKCINKKQKELAQYKSTQGKLTKNKELLQYINERLKEVNGTRICINDLQQLTNKYDTSITMWLQQLDDIEFKLNDSRIACEERIKRLEKKNEKEQMKQYSSDLSAR